MDNNRTALDLLGRLRTFYLQDKVEMIDSAPPILSSRSDEWSNSANKRYVFISYSHYDFEIVYSDLRMLWAINANYWYDKELLESTNSDSWKKLANNSILDSNCVGVLFYVSRNSFMSPAVYNEIKLCKKRMENDPDFVYKVLLIEGDSIFDIQNSLKLDALFTSQRLIDVHSLWGDESVFIKYGRHKEHIFEIASWFIKMGCINDLEYDEDHSVVVRRDYALLGNTLISYYGSGKSFSIEEQDLGKITKISSKAIASPTLREINIPEGVVEIDDFAIIACKRLDSITLPVSLEKMGFFALSNFHMKSIRVADGNERYETDSYGFLYTKANGAKYSLFASPNKSKIKFFKLADSVVNVNDFAISCCNYLKEIVFSKELRKLGYWSVKECKNLRKITLYPSIQYISPTAFVDTHIEEICFKGTEKAWMDHPKINRNDTLSSYFSNARIIFQDDE